MSSEYNKLQLLQDIIQHSPYSNWSKVSDDPDGDPQYRDTNLSNPSEALNKDGIYCHKAGSKTKNIYQLARELGIDVNKYKISGDSGGTRKEHYTNGATPKVQSKKKIDPVAIYNKAQDGKNILIKYLETRGIRLTRTSFKALLPKVYIDKDGNNNILIPIKGINDEILKLLVIVVDDEYNKIKKKIYGAGVKDDNAIIIGDFNDQRKDSLIIFEGLENALTWLQEMPDKRRLVKEMIVVTCGTTGFKQIGHWLKWQKSKNKNAIVVLDPDKDNQSLHAAIKHFDNSVSMLLPGGDLDINDALQAGKIEEFFTTLEPLSREKAVAKVGFSEEEIQEAKPLKEQTKDDEYHKHINFVKELYGKNSIRRDIITGELYIKEPMGPTEHKWSHFADIIPAIQGASFGLKDKVAGAKGKVNEVQRFSHTKFLPYLSRYRQELIPTMLVDIPEWDGEDRLLVIANKLKDSKYDNAELYQILKEFGTRALTKALNPEIENHFLLITGPQGIGKDYLIEALFGGFGFFFNPVNLEGTKNDICRQISESFVVNVAEFDQYKKQNVATIKEIITTNKINFDQKYKVGTQKIMNRTSFVGSSNKTDVLVDSTGNRRYRMLFLEEITIQRSKDGRAVNVNNYPGDRFDENRDENRAQMLAQFKHYSKEWEKYCVSEGTQQKIDGLIAEHTPESPTELLRMEFDEIVNIWLDEEKGVMNADLSKIHWIVSNKKIWLGERDLEVKVDYMLRSNGWKKAFLRRSMNYTNKNQWYYDGKFIKKVYNFEPDSHWKQWVKDNPEYGDEGEHF